MRPMSIDVHLVDGTYELFRHYFALPSHVTPDGREVGALRGVVGSVVGMLADGATHLGVATDHVVESFRNALWDGYKVGDEMPADLFSQFHPLEDVLRALGVGVWPMVEFEADDALASAAAVAAADPQVAKVFICTPDKDLAQCVEGERVVQFDRRKGTVAGHDGIVEKFGVSPASIPDYLALVGDTADGFPGLPRWGAKSAAAVLGRFGHLEDIPEDPADWDGLAVRGASGLAATLVEQRELAMLFRRIATVVCSAPTITSVDEIRWRGPVEGFEVVFAAHDLDRLAGRVRDLASRLS
jgi:5'-3' exonuclease